MRLNLAARIRAVQKSSPEKIISSAIFGTSMSEDNSNAYSTSESVRFFIEFFVSDYPMLDPLSVVATHSIDWKKSVKPSLLQERTIVYLGRWSLPYFYFYRNVSARASDLIWTVRNLKLAKKIVKSNLTTKIAPHFHPKFRQSPWLLSLTWSPTPAESNVRGSPTLGRAMT
jgi:hypothetical protein